MPSQLVSISTDPETVIQGLAQSIRNRAPSYPLVASVWKLQRYGQTGALVAPPPNPPERGTCRIGSAHTMYIYDGPRSYIGSSRWNCFHDLPAAARDAVGDWTRVVERVLHRHGWRDDNRTLPLHAPDSPSFNVARQLVQVADFLRAAPQTVLQVVHLEGMRAVADLPEDWNQLIDEVVQRHGLDLPGRPFPNGGPSALRAVSGRWYDMQLMLAGYAAAGAEALP